MDKKLKNGRYITQNGAEHWYKDGVPHREDGPASIYLDGSEYWYKNGELHREDGPAIIEPGGLFEWWYYNNHYETVQEFAKVAHWTDKQLASYLLNKS